MRHEPHLFLLRNAPLPAAVRVMIHDLLSEIAEHRPLTRQEIRLRCAMRPMPWRDLGVDRSTWYRRRQRARRGDQATKVA
jgi:hypothetical protein